MKRKQTAEAGIPGDTCWGRLLQITLTLTLTWSPDRLHNPMREKHIYFSPSLYKGARCPARRKYHLKPSRGCAGSCLPLGDFIRGMNPHSDFDSGLENGQGARHQLLTSKHSFYLTLSQALGLNWPRWSTHRQLSLGMLTDPKQLKQSSATKYKSEGLT